MRIHRLCTIVLEVIHEMDRLDALFSVDATTRLQPRSGGIQTKGRGPHKKETRHTPVVIHTRSTNISLPPHQ